MPIQVAGAHAAARAPAGCPGRKGDRDRRADQRVEVVAFEKAVVRLVMIAVPAPAEAVHHILVAAPRKAFHGDHGGKDDQRGGKRGHDRFHTARRDSSRHFLAALRRAFSGHSGTWGQEQRCAEETAD
jgi:hypothetical protein